MVLLVGTVALRKDASSTAYTIFQFSTSGGLAYERTAKVEGEPYLDTWKQVRKDMREDSRELAILVVLGASRLVEQYIAGGIDA